MLLTSFDAVLIEPGKDGFNFVSVLFPLFFSG